MVFDINNPFGLTIKSKKIKKPAGFKKTGAMGVGSMPQPSWYGTSNTLTNLGSGSSARIKQASRNKVANMAWAVKSGAGGIGEANRILAELGKPAIRQVVTRRRRGRWSTSLSADPVTVIKNYNKQKTLIEWGKKVGGLALDPNRMVSVVDKPSSKRVAITWTHNNRTRVVGYRTVNTSTYKDVLASTRPKGERWDLLMGKMGTQADAKKERYTKLYKPLDIQAKEQVAKLEKQIPTFSVAIGRIDEQVRQANLRTSKTERNNAEYQQYAKQKAELIKLKENTIKEKDNITFGMEYTRYSYYGIQEKELADSEEYKKNLITGIRQTDTVTDQMKTSINETPDENKSKEEYKKMLLDELEKEYDKEKEDFNVTATKVRARENAFNQSSVVSKPNRRIIQLANQQRSNIPKPTQPDINKNMPAPRQRGGGGFKRFQKW